MFVYSLVDLGSERIPHTFLKETQAGLHHFHLGGAGPALFIKNRDLVKTQFLSGRTKKEVEISPAAMGWIDCQKIAS